MLHGLSPVGLGLRIYCQSTLKSWGSGGAAEDPIKLKDVNSSAAVFGFTGNINATDRPASQATSNAPVTTEHMSASTEPQIILAVSCSLKPLRRQSALHSTPQSRKVHSSNPTQTLAHIRVCAVHHVDISRLRKRHVEIPVALGCDLLMASHPKCGSCYLHHKLVASHRHSINCQNRCREKPRCSDEGATSHRHIARDNVTSWLGSPRV
jgi:hypothetical protein